VLSGEQSLDAFRTLVLADDPMPGYVGSYKDQARPTGGPTPDQEISGAGATAPSQGAEGCVQSDASTEHVPFEIKPTENNAEFTVEIEWSRPTSDYDLFVYIDQNGDGKGTDDEPAAGAPSQGGPPGTGEIVTVQLPEPGKYAIVVVNCSVPPGTDPWAGTLTFKPEPSAGESRFTVEQKDAWMAKLRDWVSGGGNLVLTDGGLQALSELTSVPGAAIKKRVVYVGQTSFQICTALDEAGVCSETKETLDDPLAKNVAQFGARFNTGMRRQTFEPTPLGYAIQNVSGADASFARQWDVELNGFTAAGGRAAGGSVDAGARDAQGVPERVTLGELAVGSGKVRVLGALLPQPSTQYDHPLGIEPYAVTYTGYILFCNLVDCAYEEKPRPQLPNDPAPPGPVQLGFGARIQTPLLASKKTRNGKRVPLRIRKTGLKRISHLVLQYRRTGRGTKKSYRTLKPRLKPSTKRVRFTRGRLGRTYLFRIRAVGKTGVRTGWRHKRVVYPYNNRGKGRRYSAGWKRIKAKRAWRGGYSQSSRRGATMRFTTKGGGRVYLIARTGPNGGRALVQARGAKKRIVSFKTKKIRHRRVVTIINRTDKRSVRFRLRVLRGVVTVDGIGVRRR
jgi:hypothetical protein